MELNLGESNKEENTVLLAAQTNRAAGILITLLVLRCINFLRMKNYDKSGSGLLDGIGPTTKRKANMQLCSPHIDESSFSRPIIAGTNLRCKKIPIPGAVPTRDSVTLYSPPKLSQRDKRQVTT